MNITTTLKVFVLLSIFTLSNVFASASNDDRKSIATEIAAFTGITWGTILASITGHELGHAAGFKIAGAECKDIRIRVYPLSGSAGIAYNASQKTIKSLSNNGKLTRCSISAAGPFAGALTCYSMIKIAHIYDENKTADSFKDALRKGLKRPIFGNNTKDPLQFQFIAPFIMAGEFLQLCPINLSRSKLSDGQHIFNEIFSNHKLATQQLAKIAMRTMSVAPMGFVLYKSIKSL